MAVTLTGNQGQLVTINDRKTHHTQPAYNRERGATRQHPHEAVVAAGVDPGQGGGGWGGDGQSGVIVVTPHLPPISIVFLGLVMTSGDIVT